MEYRRLTELEINQLKDQDCIAEDWEMIKVNLAFAPDQIKDVQFGGEVFLGKFESSIDIGDGIQKPAGIRHAFIKDCVIGDNVLIANVRNLINYHIDNNVVIENVDRLIVHGETSFGNGIEINVLNENGGRKVPMFEALTAQIAYLIAIYRHNSKLTEALNSFIKHHVNSRKSGRGKIQEYSRITDCGMIKNVSIGAYARVSGAVHLEEGTLSSQQSAPVQIGSGVIAKEFIISSGSTVIDSSLLEKTFIGQSVQVGSQFSAVNSLIFCNSECFHSEVCSIFAGPYTVTHHKSTLLIAGMFSFFNAGSGSNQSNHMYKLGPIHQGIMERGSKTGSFAYLVWPSRIGPFSVVIGTHHTNFDTSDFPFSYIIASENESVLLPAINFFTVGTKRDSIKWPNRDRRDESNRLDIINFSFLTPHIMTKVIRGRDILIKLEKEFPSGETYIHYNGIIIDKPRIKKAIADYETIIIIFLGNELLSYLDKVEQIDSDNDDFILSEIGNYPDEQENAWLDLAGMISPRTAIDEMCMDICNGGLDSVEAVQSRISQIHSSYQSNSWRWCWNTIAQTYRLKQGKLTLEILSNVINAWKDACIKSNQRILDDAAKEFAPKSRIGYGLDGNNQTSLADFEHVVGKFDDNAFAIKLRAETEDVPVKADRAQAKLKSIMQKD